MHPIHLLDDYKLTLRFNLKLVGQLNPLLHPFFESVNPGFKVYVGDYLMFDYVLSGELDDVSKTQFLKLDYFKIIDLIKIIHHTNRFNLLLVLLLLAYQTNDFSTICVGRKLVVAYNVTKVLIDNKTSFF